MHSRTLLLILAAAALAACNTSSDTALPAGQTIARVDGEDVTIHELNAELKGVPLPTGPARQAVEQQALQRIIDRRILAGLARDRKLDKSPDYVLLKNRAEEAVLVSLLQQSMADRAKRPSIQDARRFVADNPSLFAERKLLTLDQIVFAMPQDSGKLQQLAPMKSMTEVEKWLIENGLQYRRQPGRIDTLQIDPAAARRIASLPPGEVFIVPANAMVSANVVTKVDPSPVPEAAATQLAMNILQNRAVLATASRELEAEVKKHRKSVVYQAGFAPPRPQAPAGSQPAGAAIPAKL